MSKEIIVIEEEKRARNGTFIKSFKATKFTNVEKELRLNESKNIVEEVGTIDLQARINSAYNSTFDMLIDKYLTGEVVDSFIEMPNAENVVYNNGQLLSKIDRYQALSIEADSLKKQFNLDRNLSIEDTFKTIVKLKEDTDKKCNEYSEQIKSYKLNRAKHHINTMDKLKDDSKEIQDNEK